MKNNFALLLLLLPLLIHAQAPDIEWQNTIGGGGSERINSLQQTLDGGYILGGSSGSNISGDKEENCIGDMDYWVVKLDSIGNIVWQNTIGGDSEDILIAIQQTCDTGYILAGWSLSGISGDKTENNIGSYDFWMVKLDSLGAIEWQNTIGGSGSDKPQSIEIISTNEYLIAGWSDSEISGDKTEGSRGSYDYWILKLDSLGNIIWQKTIGGSDVDAAYCIKHTIDGSIIIGGHSKSPASGDKTESCIYKPSSLPSQDYWAVKLDSTGNIIWQNVIGGNIDDFMYGIDILSEDKFIIGGVSNSGVSSDKEEENIGENDYWILTIDTSGSLDWQKTIGGTANDLLTTVKRTLNNGYIISGYSLSGATGSKTEPNIGADDYWILKLDSLGEIQWQNSLGGSLTDKLFAGIQTTDGGYLLGGESESDSSSDKAENSIGNSDIWIIKLLSDDSCSSTLFYADYDGDGYGNVDFPILSCDTPSIYVLNNLDCNDFNPSINPASEEICNSIDDNCNAIIDEDIPYYTYYEDSDADGYGNVLSPVTNCMDTVPAGYVTDSTDCDDANNTIHEPAIYYADNDGDLYGDTFNTGEFCSASPPDGYVTNDLDCNDADNSINPTSNELCNALDDNCNGEIDEDLPVQVLYTDADGDTYGNPATDTTTCLFAISGYVSDSTDCDDTNENIYPGAEEVFNGTDDNCDEEIDEGVSIQETINKNLFTVYPNPNSGSFTIESQTMNFQEQTQIIILNSTGQVVYEKNLITEKTEIQLPEYLHGIFQININEEKILVYSDHIAIIK